MQAVTNIVESLYAAKTEAGTAFKEITKQSLGAALKWRGEQFKN